MRSDLKEMAVVAKRWLSIAQAEVGVEEMPGDRENPKILEYFKSAQFAFKKDETPWCAAFVSWCLEKAGVRSTHHALAMKYESYGVEIKEPFPGAICVLKRGDGTQRHVGFYVNESTKSIFVLGGNQSNSVRVTPFAKSLLVCYRYPSPEDLLSETLH